MTARKASSYLISRLFADAAPHDPSEPRLPRSRRSLWAFGAAAAGLIVARYGPIFDSAAWFGASLLMVALAAAMRGPATRIGLWLALCTLAGGWLTLRVHEVRADSLERWIEHDPLGEPALASVEGVVEGWPREGGARGALARFGRLPEGSAFDLSVWRIEAPDGRQVGVGGRLRVHVDGAPGDIEPVVRPGACVRVTGRLAPVRPALNPGEPDWFALARQDGRAGTLHVPRIELIQSGAARGWREGAVAMQAGVLGKARRFAATTLRAPVIPRASASEQSDTLTRREQARALLGAMLLGERSADLDDVNSAFARLGLLHLVAISGFNLVVMAGVAMFILRLGGERGWLEPAGVGLLIGLYMLVLPAQAPIFRAGAIALVFLVAEAFGRRYDRLTLLGWIAIAALAIRPLDLWSPGFQLSFGVVAALLALGDHVRDRIFGPLIRGVLPPGVAPGRVGVGQFVVGAGHWFWRAAKSHITAAVIAWCIATPVIAYHTGLVSPLAVLTTLIVLPLTVVVLWVGYTALLLGAVIPPMAGAAAAVLDGVGVMLVEVVMLLDQIPAASFRVPRLSAGLAFACVALGWYWLWRGRRRDRVAWALTFVIAAWIAGEVVLGPRLAVGGAFRIDTLAVGDGSCHLLRVSRGVLRDPETLLWDCGSINSSLGERRIPDALRALGVRDVPTAILTHAHFDHYSALPDVLEPMGVRRVLVSPHFLAASGPTDAGPLAALRSILSGHPIETQPLAQGDTVSLGEATMTIFWPPADRDFRDANDKSLVARISVPTAAGTRSALFTGDISREAVPSLLPASGGDGPTADLRADVLELPHHGAYLDAAAELVRLSGAGIVLQSTGPVRARDRRWEPFKIGRTWHVTCIDGATCVTITRDGSVRAMPLTPVPRR